MLLKEHKQNIAAIVDDSCLHVTVVEMINEHFVKFAGLQ